MTLADGRLVHASECVEGSSPGAVVALLACPDTGHIAAMAASRGWDVLPPPPSKSPVIQGGSVEEGVEAQMLVHFGKQEVCGFGFGFGCGCGCE